MYCNLYMGSPVFGGSVTVKMGIFSPKFGLYAFLDILKSDIFVLRICMCI